MSWSDATRELRRAPRILAGWDVTLTDGAGRRWRGTAIDVSPQGMRVKLRRRLDPHRFLLLSFTPPDGEGPLWVDVRIVRQYSDAVYGVQFLNLSSVAQKRLAPLIESQGVASAGSERAPRRPPNP